jgi:hypothetical protein
MPRQRLRDRIPGGVTVRCACGKRIAIVSPERRGTTRGVGVTSFDSPRPSVPVGGGAFVDSSDVWRFTCPACTEGPWSVSDEALWPVLDRARRNRTDAYVTEFTLVTRARS